MQQDHTTARLVAAVTSCVYPKFRSGRATNLAVLPDPFTALSTSCLIVEHMHLATTYSPKTTPMAHYLTNQRRVQFAT